MGRLAGLNYRQVTRILKRFQFKFDRQAAGSHEIWFNEGTNRYTTIPRHPGDIPPFSVICHSRRLLAGIQGRGRLPL